MTSRTESAEHLLGILYIQSCCEDLVQNTEDGVIQNLDIVYSKQTGSSYISCQPLQRNIPIKVFLNSREGSNWFVQTEKDEKQKCSNYSRLCSGIGAWREIIFKITLLQ